MEVERKDNQSEDLNSSGQQESSNETSQNGTALPEAEATQASPTGGTETFSSLLPKALSAVVQARLPPGPTSEPKPCRKQGGQTAPRLEQLQTELQELRGQFEQMKTQHNKEIKLLMNELDEEKRIRLTLQMEIQRMKKHLSK